MRLLPQDGFRLLQVLVSMVAGVQIIWILEYMILLDNNLGALILTVKEMLRDVSLFMVIFSIVIMASTIPFVCFSRMGYYEGEYADDFHPRSTITVPLWSTFGEVSAHISRRSPTRLTPRTRAARSTRSARRPVPVPDQLWCQW